MQVHFRRIKDIAASPLHLAVRATQPAPPLQRAMFRAMGLFARGYYHLPGSHVRRTVKHFARLAARQDPQAIYGGLVDNVVWASILYGALMRDGAAAVARFMDFDPAAKAHCDRVAAEQGCGIFVVPHCAGSVLAAAGLARAYRCVVLVRESKDAQRSALWRRYFERLDTDLLFVRRNDPAAVARVILKALQQKKFIIGTTDLLRKTDDTVDVEVFGCRAHLPAWPARFSSRRGAPILPSYIHMDAGKLVLFTGEPYIENDLVAGTQRWAACFEGFFRRWPEDWIFMYEKRWARLIAQAAGA